MSAYTEERQRREAERYRRLRETNYKAYERAAQIGAIVSIELGAKLSQADALHIAHKLESSVVSLALDLIDSGGAR